jgi:hypothetical protein
VVIEINSNSIRLISHTPSVEVEPVLPADTAPSMAGKGCSDSAEQRQGKLTKLLFACMRNRYQAFCSACLNLHVPTRLQQDWTDGKCSVEDVKDMLSQEQYCSVINMEQQDGWTGLSLPWVPALRRFRPFT